MNFLKSQRNSNVKIKRFDMYENSIYFKHIQGYAGGT